ncbi:hypothetical protein EAF00_011764 [Botryotinia globosa]|nr:hypothetical protein EAF00_011764 [Botryotinia globosa]
MVLMRYTANIPINEVSSSHLITEIPEDEHSVITETAESFATKNPVWDILISQKQYVEVAVERSSARKKLLWMSRKSEI